MKNLIVYICIGLFFLGVLSVIADKASGDAYTTPRISKVVEHDGMTIYEFRRGPTACFIVRTKVMGGGAASMTCY